MSGPLPDVLAPLTVPLSWAYGWGVARRNRRLDRGRGVQSLPVPVISIGNIRTGGTGKTPMVAWVARALLARGKKPLIAMRGYGAAPGEAGDEEREYAASLPDVPVVANPRRHDAVSAYLKEHDGIDAVLLDDGFQHRQLARDLDLVLVDAAMDLCEARLLPAGHLREQPAALARADGVIITHASSETGDIEGAVRRFHGRDPIARATHHWTGLSLYGSEAPAQAAPCEWLKGRRILTMLGVARPELVRKQLEDAGAAIAADLPCRDHEPYDAARLAVARGLCDGVDAMVVTAKDWVKIEPLIGNSPWPIPIAVPKLEIKIIAGEEALAAMICDATL